MDTLQDQCGTRTGRVQVQFVILPGKEKEEEDRRGVLDIVDVLKSSEEEPSQEEKIRGMRKERKRVYSILKHSPYPLFLYELHICNICHYITLYS